MAEKELKIAIKEEIEREKERILNQAKKEAEDILSEANKQVNSVRDSRIKELEERMQREKQKLSHELSPSARKEVLMEKEKVFGEVIDAVMTGLESIRGNRNEYYEILKSLTIESKEDFPDDVKLKIRISTEDVQLCEELVHELKLNAEIEGGLTCTGGLTMSDLAERYICYNTFESRLEKLMPRLKRELHEIWLQH